MAIKDLPLVKANQLRNLILNFLRYCAREDVFLPYFVFDGDQAITTEASLAFTNQIVRTYSSLHSAFTGPNQRQARQISAVQSFERLSPPAAVRGDTALTLVTVLPNPYHTRIRFSVQALADFFRKLTDSRFSALNSHNALSLALSHSFRCTVNYNDPAQNNFPALPATEIPEMADNRPPIITLTPTLPQFSGKPEEDVDLFLSRLDRVLAVYPDATAAQRLFYLENQCTGTALDTIHDSLQYLSDNPLNPPRTDDQVYSHVKDELTDSYKIDRDTHSYRDQLQSRVKLDSESFPEYVQSVLRLCRRAGIKNETEKLANLHKGLPLYLASTLHPSDYATVKEFLDKVTQTDKVLGATMRTHTAHAIHEKSSLPAPLQSPPFPPPVRSTPSDRDANMSARLDKIEAMIEKLQLTLAQPAANYVHYNDVCDSSFRNDQNYEPHHAEYNNLSNQQDSRYSYENPYYQDQNRNNSYSNNNINFIHRPTVFQRTPSSSNRLNSSSKSTPVHSPPQSPPHSPFPPLRSLRDHRTSPSNSSSRVAHPKQMSFASPNFVHSNRFEILSQQDDSNCPPALALTDNNFPPISRPTRNKRRAAKPRASPPPTPRARPSSPPTPLSAPPIRPPPAPASLSSAPSESRPTPPRWPRARQPLAASTAASQPLSLPPRILFKIPISVFDSAHAGLIDSGSTFSLCRLSVVDPTWIDTSAAMPDLCSASGLPLPLLGVITIPVTCGSVTVPHPFYVCSDLGHPFILGLSWLYGTQSVINFKDDNYSLTFNGNSVTYAPFLPSAQPAANLARRSPPPPQHQPSEERHSHAPAAPRRPQPRPAIVDQSHAPIAIIQPSSLPQDNFPYSPRSYSAVAFSGPPKQSYHINN